MDDNCKMQRVVEGDNLFIVQILDIGAFRD